MLRNPFEIRSVDMRPFFLRLAGDLYELLVSLPSSKFACQRLPSQIRRLSRGALSVPREARVSEKPQHPKIHSNVGLSSPPSLSAIEPLLNREKHCLRAHAFLDRPPSAQTHPARVPESLCKPSSELKDMNQAVDALAGVGCYKAGLGLAFLGCC